MEHIGKFVLYLILAVNALFVGMLILSAYSPYLQPKIHPIASCLGLAFPIFLAVNICFTLFWVIISYRYALLPVIGFLVCIPQIRTYIPINSTVETIPDGSIKFLSYNVMGFNNLEKKEGKNPILSYLADSEADIICLQEYNSTKNKKYLTDEDIRKALKAYPYRSIHNPEKGGSQLACFSKFPILSARPIKYESTYNGSMQYTLKVNEDTITLINNHLESNKLTKEDKVIYGEVMTSKAIYMRPLSSYGKIDRLTISQEEEIRPIEVPERKATSCGNVFISFLNLRRYLISKGLCYPE